MNELINKLLARIFQHRDGMMDRQGVLCPMAAELDLPFLH